jgi:predicted 3-demethylubiquinone-9 3-methyltransferase (glyoxalase superfamily)
MPQKITPFIRCDNNWKEVAQYYVDVFWTDAKIVKQNPVVTELELFWQSVATLIGWPYPGALLNPSISFSLWIKDRADTEEIRKKLSDGGSILMDFADYPRSKWYGRCNDKFGVSRQVMFDDRKETTSNALIPSLMFVGENAGKAQEAMNLYTSLFPASKIINTWPYGENAAGEIPTNLNHAEFTLVNQLFIAMDSSWPHKFNFTDGISFSVSCKDQEEVDYYRNALALDGGTESQCWRCKDKYGVARQIIPLQLPEALFNSDKEKSQKAMQAMMKMKKIIIADLTA